METSKVITLQVEICHLKEECRRLNQMLNRVKYVGFLWRPVGSPTWTFSEEDKPKKIKPEYEIEEVYSFNDK